MVIQDLTKSYGSHVVFKDLQVLFPQGQCSVLMGPSGCGKTTLLRLIMGLETPDGGSIRKVPARVSAVFQEDRLLEQLSVRKNLQAVLGKEAGISAIREALAQVGMEETINQRVLALSGGMKRRVAIVRACMAKSGLLLLDEPFKGLDAETKEKVMQYVKKSMEGRTCILATHDMQEAAFFGGHVFRMELNPAGISDTRCSRENGDT